MVNDRSNKENPYSLTVKLMCTDALWVSDDKHKHEPKKAAVLFVHQV